MRLRRRKCEADPQRIHELEFGLGYRDDPPGPTGRPGEILYYRSADALARAPHLMLLAAADAPEAMSSPVNPAGPFGI